MARSKQLTKLEIAAFCDQMAMIINAGITPKDGLELMLSDAKDKNTKEVLEAILEVSRKGEVFATCIKESGYFPPYVVNMVALGEETGKLDDVLLALDKYYEHEEEVSDNLRSAITYPIIMIAMMAVIIIILITKVLPLFNQVFIQLGAQMTGVAGSLLAFGNTIQTYSWSFVLALGGLMVIAVIFAGTSWGRNAWSKFLSVFPPTRKYQKDVAYGRFARGMSLTLSSGMRIYPSLDLVDDLVENNKVAEEVKLLKNYIVEGYNFSESLGKAGIFSNLYSRMIYIGVKSGNVDVVLAKIASLYEEDTDKRLRNFISILEPTLVICLSLVVGLILLSVILPLLGVMASMG